jgi:hypothetical protein
MEPELRVVPETRTSGCTQNHNFGWNPNVVKYPAFRVPDFSCRVRVPLRKKPNPTRSRLFLYPPVSSQNALAASRLAQAHNTPVFLMQHLLKSIRSREGPLRTSRDKSSEQLCKKTRQNFAHRSKNFNCIVHFGGGISPPQWERYIKISLMQCT